MFTLLELFWRTADNMYQTARPQSAVGSYSESTPGSVRSCGTYCSKSLLYLTVMVQFTQKCLSVDITKSSQFLGKLLV